MSVALGTAAAIPFPIRIGCSLLDIGYSSAIACLSLLIADCLFVVAS
jgi:hypothetical protein